MVKKADLLLVDDHPANLLALDAVLGGDYNLIFASSGIEAIEILGKNSVDLILLDIQMPEIDGFETAKRIKKIAHCKNIPIVFVTAIYTEPPFVKQGYESGGIDYFTKPFDPEIMKMKIAFYTSLRQKEQLLDDKEKRIQESEDVLRAGQKLTSTLGQATYGVVVTDLNGAVKHTNDILHDICKGLKKNGHPPYFRFLKGVAQVLKTGECAPSELHEVRCEDGSIKTIRVCVSPLLKGQKPSGAVVVIQDVTDDRKIGEVVEESAERLSSPAPITGRGFRAGRAD